MEGSGGLIITSSTAHVKSEGALLKCEPLSVIPEAAVGESMNFYQGFEGNVETKVKVELGHDGDGNGGSRNLGYNYACETQVAGAIKRKSQLLLKPKLRYSVICSRFQKELAEMPQLMIPLIPCDRNKESATLNKATMNTLSEVGITNGELSPRFSDDIGKPTMESDSVPCTEKDVKGRTCAICEEVLTSKRSCIIHEMTEHFSKVDPSLKLYECLWCSRSFVSAKDLRDHEFSHTGMRCYPCRVCGEKFSSQDEKRKHLSWCKDRIHRIVGAAESSKERGSCSVECELCEKIFKSNQGLRVHKRYCKGELPMEKRVEKVFKCLKCPGRYFAEELQLERHESFHLNDGKFPCSRCNFKSRSLESLQRHKFSHHERSNLLECSVCDKKFRCSTSLKDHALQHSKEKPYKCRLCPQSFANTGTCWSHEIEAHVRDAKKLEILNKFKCSYCTKSFFKRGYLTVHERSHTGEKPFKCNFCSKMFSRGVNRKRHEMSVHREIVKNYEKFNCLYCSKTFGAKSSMVRHARVHVNVGIKCNFCDKQFIHKSSVLRHEKSMHGDARKDCLPQV